MIITNKCPECGGPVVCIAPVPTGFDGAFELASFREDGVACHRIRSEFPCPQCQKPVVAIKAALVVSTDGGGIYDLVSLRRGSAQPCDTECCRQALGSSKSEAEELARLCETGARAAVES